MKAKISLQAGTKETISEAFDQYVSDCKGQGLSDRFIDTYRHHFKALGPFLAMETPVGELSHKDIEQMITKMREKGLARNSILSYLRTFKSFILCIPQKAKEYFGVTPIINRHKAVAVKLLLIYNAIIIYFRRIVGYGKEIVYSGYVGNGTLDWYDRNSICNCWQKDN